MAGLASHRRLGAYCASRPLILVRPQFRRCPSMPRHPRTWCLGLSAGPIALNGMLPSLLRPRDATRRPPPAWRSAADRHSSTLPGAMTRALPRSPGRNATSCARRSLADPCRFNEEIREPGLPLAWPFGSAASCGTAPTRADISICSRSARRDSSQTRQHCRGSFYVPAQPPQGGGGAKLCGLQWGDIDFEGASSGECSGGLVEEVGSSSQERKIPPVIIADLADTLRNSRAPTRRRSPGMAGGHRWSS